MLTVLFLVSLSWSSSPAINSAHILSEPIGMFWCQGAPYSLPPPCVPRYPLHQVGSFFAFTWARISQLWFPQQQVSLHARFSRITGTVTLIIRWCVKPTFQDTPPMQTQCSVSPTLSTQIGKKKQPKRVPRQRQACNCRPISQGDLSVANGIRAHLSLPPKGQWKLPPPESPKCSIELSIHHYLPCLFSFNFCPFLLPVSES
jgi:hypothetical protein